MGSTYYQPGAQSAQTTGPKIALCFPRLSVCVSILITYATSHVCSLLHVASLEPRLSSSFSSLADEKLDESLGSRLHVAALGVRQL